MADTKAAAMNFLNALERIPNIVEQYKTKNEAIEKDLPILQEIAGRTWRKEDEPKVLKSELAALDRKIQLELASPMQDKTQVGDENIHSEQSVLSSKLLHREDYRADLFESILLGLSPMIHTEVSNYHSSYSSKMGKDSTRYYCPFYL